jgi:hypothetical protein
MWSLKNTLGLISSNLPVGFSARNGVKSLFPSNYKGTIGVLSAYVFTRTGDTWSFEQSDYASYFVAADGTGRWFFSWNGIAYALDESADGINIRLQAGFVFLYTNDGVARGFVDTSRPNPSTLSCASGTDPWIAENWPNLFLSTVYCDYQEAAGFDSLPPESNIWINAGFPQANFAALSGGNVPSSGQGSGSTLFPLDEQNIYCVLQIRDPSLLESLQNPPANQFWQKWAEAQPSKQTIERLTQYVNLRYLSPDWRTAIISGSARSLGALSYVGATLTAAGWQPTLGGASDNITTGFANWITGGAVVAASPAAIAVGPEGPPIVAVLGCAQAQLGQFQMAFGLIEGAYVLVKSALSSTPITTPATQADPSGVQVYGASQDSTGAATGSQAGTGSQTGSIPTYGEIDTAGNWIWYLDVDGTKVYNVDSLPIAGPGDVPDAPGTGIGTTVPGGDDDDDDDDGFEP